MVEEPTAEPTQQTHPKQGMPVDIPIPTEDQIETDFNKIVATPADEGE